LDVIVGGKTSKAPNKMPLYIEFYMGTQYVSTSPYRLPFDRTPGKARKCQEYKKKITVVIGPARYISTAMIPTSKSFSEYFWGTLYFLGCDFCGYDMDMFPPRYGCSCRPSFWNFVRNLGFSQAIRL